MGLHLAQGKRTLVGSRERDEAGERRKDSHPRAQAATPNHGACIPSKKDRMKNIYVGNLDFNVSEDELRQAFAAYGQVDTVTILKDRDTGQPRGFGFVEMANDEEAEKAINGINGTQLGSRVLNVNEARPKVNKGGGFGGGRGGFGGGRGGNRQGGRGGGGGFRNRY
jgi:RNA recognition motif-containing protein